MRSMIDFNGSDFTFFREGLGAVESNSNYNEINTLGFLGKYQFGEGFLVDLGYYTYIGDNTKRENTWEGQWTGKDGINNAWDFLGSPTVQDKAFNEGIELRWNWIERRGLDKYIGTKINGITITEAGLLAASWLNPGGLFDFLKSNGAVNYTEAGDSISQRLSQFSSGFDIPFIVNTNPFMGWQLQACHNQLLQCHQFFTTSTTAQSPLILDLDGDGVETTLATDGAYFDHDKNGFAEQTGWAGSDDGLLVWDRNNDGIINDLRVPRIRRLFVKLLREYRGLSFVC